MLLVTGTVVRCPVELSTGALLGRRLASQVIVSTSAESGISGHSSTPVYTEEALAKMQQIMQRLRLTVNDEKTHICRVPGQYFDFLGYQFGRFYSAETGKAYLGTRPSKKSVKRLITSIHELTVRRTHLLDAEVLVDNVNRKLRGWANYFKLGPVSRAYKAVDKYTTTRPRRWLRNKHKVRGGGHSRYPDGYLYESLGLVRLPALTRNLPWAKA